MPNDLIITMLATIVAGVIAHQINQSAFMTTISQNAGKVTRKLVILAMRFWASIFIFSLSFYQISVFLTKEDAVGRWEIFALVYFVLMAFEAVKFAINDFVDIRTGRRPL